MSAARHGLHWLVLSSLVVAGCNSVFGLDEGHVPSGGSGGAQSTQSAGTTMSTSTGLKATGAGNSTSATMSVTGPGAGGGCTEESGITNGDFSLQQTGGPANWSKIADNTQVNLSTVSGLTTGLSMAYATIGVGAYGGIYQTKSFIDWNHCVRLSGDSQRKNGISGELHAQVILGATYALDLDLPVQSGFQTFQSICRLPTPIDGFNATLLGQNLPVNGTVTMEMNYVAVDEVCCAGTEPDCPPKP